MFGRFSKLFLLAAFVGAGLLAHSLLVGPVQATSYRLSKPSPKNSVPQPRKPLSALRLAMRALAATCVRFPNGLGLSQAVAPGTALSLPPLPPQAAQKLSSAVGSLGWRLPQSLGVAVLVLRPGGACSILIKNVDPAGIEAAVREVFRLIPSLRLKKLESNACVVGGRPVTTRVYAMIPANGKNRWSEAQIIDGKTVWRGFLLSVGVRRDAVDRHQVAMTTFFGRHEMGMKCAPGEHARVAP